jgi:GNAT superfamily N-acetyltransferase
MADTDQIAIIRLGPDDALAGLALSAEAHWNQNEADWRFFLGKGTVFGVRDNDGHLIATAALLPYSSGNAWISMVLVTASWRRRGLATKLVDACLDAATKQGFVTWLDATPAGAGVYGPLGFAPTLQLRRLRLDHAMSTKAEAPPSLSPGGIEKFSAQDRLAMGFDRSALLA